jgi:2-dehydro-3-deoxy-D-arabinonate dehydratase
VDAPARESILAPIVSQEVWAAGVTYFRSRTARMEESKDAGGGSFYDRVYAAERPGDFLQSHAAARRASRSGDASAQRLEVDGARAGADALRSTHAARSSATPWATTFPAATSKAKTRSTCRRRSAFKLCAALGPAILIQNEPPAPATTRIHLQIDRAGAAAFEGETTLAQLKRTPQELAGFLLSRQHLSPPAPSS